MSNRTAKVYALPYAATSGGSPVAAAGTVTFAGTITASGTAYLTVCGEEMSFAYTTNTTVTQIAAGFKALINARAHLPVTADNTAGVLTITAKILGQSQGDGTVGVIRYRSSATAGTGLTATDSGAALGLGTGTAGADGTTTENAGLVSALANIDTARFHYMGFSVWDTTDTAAIETHVAAKSEPNPGLRCVSVSAYTDTLSNCATIAVARNFERHHIVWQKNSEHDTAELAANVVAILQKHEEVDSAFAGFDSYRRSDWGILAAYDRADWPSSDDIDDAVTDGIIPVSSDQAGSSVAMMVNTRSKNSAGTEDDFRATERHRVAVMDDFVDTVLVQHANQWTSKGFKLRDDQRNLDGSINVNQKRGANVLTPSTYQAWFLRRIQDFVDAERFQDAAEWKASTRINIDPQNSSRLEVGTSGRVIDIHHQTTFRTAETNPG